MQVWPVKEPDVMVSTPAALLNYLYSIDPERRRRSEFIRSVKYVVIFLELFRFGYEKVISQYSFLVILAVCRFLMRQICCFVEVSRTKWSDL